MTKTSLLLTLSLLTALAGCSDPVEASSPSAGQVAERVLAEERVEAQPSLDHIDEPVVATRTPEPAPVEPAPRPELSGPELRSIDGVTLARLAVATGIENREPVNASQEIAADAERVYAFLELRNAGDDQRTVVVTFERPDRTVTGDVELTVPAHAPRWRTWAWSRYVRAEGEWKAIVRTPDGELLGRIPFTVVR